MSKGWEFEFSEPNHSERCECCGGVTVRLTRFIYRDGNPYGIYYATYSNNHSDKEIHALLSLGKWDEDSGPEDRVAFHCRIRSAADSYQVMLGDAAESSWGEVELVGAKLSRDEALQHPSKATVFEILDEAIERDPSLRGYLHRCDCGDTAVPLEQAFGAPDDVFALSNEEQQKRAEIGRVFVVLDGERYFVRCLVPIPVEGYGEWCPSIWVEVSDDDFQRIKDVWDEPEEYRGIQFNGTAANGLEELGLKLSSGSHLKLGVGDTEQPPRILSSTDPEIDALVKNVWALDDFESYAVGRGFL